MLNNKQIGILFILFILFMQVIPVSKSESQIWENEYGKLEVYPKYCYSPIGVYKQYYNISWYYPENNIDFAFGFNYSLKNGCVYYKNGEYQQVPVNHIKYNDRHFYVVENVHFNQNEMKQGYIEYESFNVSGKWDLYIKLHSDTWNDAFMNNRYIELCPWFNSDWEYKRLIQLNSSMVPNDETNFPVCINITDENLSNYAQTDGDDICFIAQNETYQYNHEIDTYDYQTGRLIAWVNITNLNGSAKSNTTLYMYFGNPSCINQENITGTWSKKEFRMVHHFTGTAYDEILDSTYHDNDITSSYGNPVFEVPSQLGEGVSFDGDGDYLTITDSDSLSFPSGEKLTCMALGNFSTNGVVVGKWGNNYEYMLRIITSRIGIALYGSEGRYRTGSTIFIPENNIVLTWNYDGSDADLEDGAKLYLDADQDNPYTDSGGTSSGRMTNKDGNVGIGADYDGDNPLAGTLDELFLMGVLQDDNWIIAFNNTLNHAYNGGFFSIGFRQNYSDTNPCECFITDISIDNGQTNVNSTINLTVNVNSSCGIMDYVNLSLVCFSCDYLNYTNFTDCENGTYYLNLTGLTSLTNYTWYINTSCNNTLNHTSLYFITKLSSGGCDCDEIQNIIRYELNRYNALKENDNVNILISETQFIILIELILFGFFMWFGFSTPALENQEKMKWHYIPFSGGLMILFGGIDFLALTVTLNIYDIPIIAVFLGWVGIIIIIEGIMKGFFYDGN